MSDSAVLLDLHTHPFEAMGVGRPSDIRPDHVLRLVHAGQAAGLSGLAVTEHAGWGWGRRAVEIAADLDTQGFLILAGQEHWSYPLEIVEVELGADTVLRFIAHPGAPGLLSGRVEEFGPLHGIEISNAMHDWHIDRHEVNLLAEAHGWATFSNSDAHALDVIGSRHNVIRLDELARLCDEESGQTEWLRSGYG